MFWVSEYLGNLRYVDTTENTVLTGAVVDTCHKARNLKKDGTPGSQKRFNVNMYRTQSSVLVNGPKVEIFLEHFYILLKL